MLAVGFRLGPGSGGRLCPVRQALTTGGDQQCHRSGPHALTMDKVKVEIRSLEIVECLVKRWLDVVGSVERVPELIQFEQLRHIERWAILEQ